MIELPSNHYHHLKRLADLRRINITDGIHFLFQNVDPNSDNWIDKHYGPSDETIRVAINNIDIKQLTERIQGLPRNIRSVTDGPYLKSFSFFHQDSGLLGIEAEGVKLLDFEMSTHRDRDVFRLVKDLLPAMTVEQYRIYNTFNSQFLRLIREPSLFTMPNKKAPAIDAGAYIGYKAFALANCNGNQDVLAFEMVGDNFEVLKLNVANNPKINIIPIRAALSDKKELLPIHTRNQKSMAHSLTTFHNLKEAQTSLLSMSQSSLISQEIITGLLDDYTKNYDQISALHISVNGHEPEVCLGAIETFKKTEIARISCPYKRNEKPIFDIVVEILQRHDIHVFGKSGAAVIAGKHQKNYHAIPLKGLKS